MRFIDDGLDLFQRQGRAGYQRSVRLPHVHCTDEILGRVDLDPVDAMQFGLAHGGAREPWRIDVFVFRQLVEEAQRLRIRVVVGRSLVEGLADDLHPRSLHKPRIDGVAKVNRVKSTTRVHVQHGREAGIEIGLGIRQRNECALRRRFASGVHVHVRVYHAGQHRSGAEIDHFRLARNLHSRADL